MIKLWLELICLKIKYRLLIRINKKLKRELNREAVKEAEAIIKGEEF